MIEKARDDARVDIQVGEAATEDVPLPAPGTSERADAEKSLLRRLDVRLLPTIVIIYVMNYIDVSTYCYNVIPALMKDHNSVLQSALHGYRA